MSNKPRKKKKKPSTHNSASRLIEAFDNYAQFEKAIDDIIELLNAQLTTITCHDDEIAIIENYLIHRKRAGNYTLSFTFQGKIGSISSGFLHK